jgi:hypothetical protein
VADFFSLTVEERAATWEMVGVVRRKLDEGHRPDAYNVGINIGNAAGQTVEHAHIHVVPRYTGDVADPRGGVRWIIPSKARYWTLEPVAEDRGVIGFAEKMLGLLDEGRFTATYKYAVLLGLMDLCIENTTASGAPPSVVTTDQLAGKVLETYWPHTSGATFTSRTSDRTRRPRSCRTSSSSEVATRPILRPHCFNRKLTHRMHFAGCCAESNGS